MPNSELEINMAEVKKDIAYLREGHEDLKNDVRDGFDILGAKIDCLDKKFASKWVESAIIWTVRIVVGAVLLSLLGLVIVK